MMNNEMAAIGQLILLLVGVGLTRANDCPYVIQCRCYSGSGEEYNADCSGSNITVFPPNLPTNVTHLSITATNITDLPDGTHLRNLVDLIELKLYANNDLRTIGPNAFTGLNKVKLLDLHGNQLTSLPGSLLVPLSQLEDLNLGMNLFDSVPSLPPALNKLLKLNLEGNRITQLGTPFGTLTSLEYLNVQRNQMTSVDPTAFRQLTSLTELDMDYNNITELPDGLFTGLGNLDHLSLTFNLLERIEAGRFSGLTGLTQLSLMDNKLQSVPKEALGDLAAIQILDLSGNRFETLAYDDFSNVAHLQHLRLNDMETLVTLEPNAFKDLNALIAIQLTRNRNLASLEPTIFESNSNLQAISVYYNNFTYLDQRLFTGLDNLRDVHLYGNPFHCNCDIDWMYEVVRDDVIWARNWRHQSPTCASPPHLITLEIARMMENDLTCDPAEIQPISDLQLTANVLDSINIQIHMLKGLPTSLWRTPDGAFFRPPLFPLGIDETRRSVQESILPANHTVTSTLRVLEVSSHDAGTYVAYATNVNGNTTLQFTLEVKDHPIVDAGCRLAVNGVVLLFVSLVSLLLKA